MSYIVLARKWRPKTFSDVTGQRYITIALKNAITSGKLAHALIFSGPRGVGKTTTARIVAKALNCINLENEKLTCENGDHTCSFCSEISEGRCVDVLEIDAASHTGVDDVREITENVKYLPGSAKKKVYIIDEAHMLSQSAFNALLKTLEEPPDHVLFILATTESHKIPATIRSRCQSYDFKKLSINEIKSQLEQISEFEEVSIDQQTLITISKEADGSIRDALSIMDQLMATFGSNISYDETLNALGLLDKTHLYELLKGIIEKKTSRSIETLKHITSRGIIHKRIADDLVNMLRNSLFIKICGDELDMELTDDDIKNIKNLVSGKSAEDIELLFSLAIENADSVHRSYFPDLALESMIIKLASIDTTIPINQIMEKIENLSVALNNNTIQNKKVNVAPTIQSTQKETVNDEEKTEEKIFDTFTSFIKSQNTILGLYLEKSDSITRDEKTLKIVFNDNSISFEKISKKDSLNNLKSLASDFYKTEMNVRVELSDGQASAKHSENRLVTRDEKTTADNRVFKEAIKIFDGKIVKN